MKHSEKKSLSSADKRQRQSKDTFSHPTTYEKEYVEVWENKFPLSIGNLYSHALLLN